MYLLIKTSENKVEEEGSLFEAARGHWRMNPERVSRCSRAIVTLKGNKDIKAVYTLDKVYPSTVVEGRHVFSGNRDEELESKLVGKTLNPKLTSRSAQYPILYVQEDELLAV